MQSIAKGGGKKAGSDIAESEIRALPALGRNPIPICYLGNLSSSRLPDLCLPKDMNHRVRQGVRLKVGAIILLLSVGATAQDRPLKSIDCDQFLSWMAAGIPSQSCRGWHMTGESHSCLLAGQPRSYPRQEGRQNSSRTCEP